MSNPFGTGIPVELQWAGADSKSVTTSAAIQQQTSELRGLPLKLRKHNLIALRVVVEAQLTVTQSGGTGSIIQDDKLAKTIASLALWLPDIGWVHRHEDTTGAAHKNVHEVIANGYRVRGVRDTAIPAANGSSTRKIRYQLPLALPVMAEPLDTAMPMALLEGGKLEVKVAANSSLAGDSTGCTVDTVVLRAWIEAIPTRKVWVPGLFGFRRYDNPGGVNNILIKGLGNAQGLSAAEDGCALAAFFMYTDRLGLGGSDGPDNITGVQCTDLDLPNIIYPAALFEMLDQQIDGVTDIGGMALASIGQQRWPFTTSETVFTGGNVDDTVLFPLKMPARGQQLSRLRRFNKSDRDFNVKYTFTSTPAGTMSHGTLEFYKAKSTLEAKVRALYSIPAQWKAVVKPVSGKPLTAGTLHALRYGARQMFYAP